MRPPGFEATWVDLVEVEAGAEVLLVGEQRAREPLTAAGAVVATGRTADLVCADGVPVTERLLSQLSDAMSDDGRLVMVVDNALSPLRAADVAVRRPHGAATRTTPRGLARALSAVGFEVTQLFALLRSSVAPVTAFDVTSRSAMNSVLTASLGHVGGSRGAVLRRLATMPPGAVARLAPAWLVVAARPGRPLDPLRIVGKVANQHSEEVKLVRGDPPVRLEKRYHGGPPAAEIEALRELETVGFDLAPRLVGVPGSDRAVFTWLPGRPLVVERLSDDELVAWTRRAARVLGELQALTRRPDGTVLVHGDYWLGNLLADAAGLTGLVDWTEAHRGDPGTDRRFLVDSTAAAVEEGRGRDDGLRARLEAAVS